MTRSGDPADRDKPCGSGQFLVVYGSGPEAEDVARDVAKQCDDHNVYREVLPIDRISQVCTWHYPALIVVLPSIPGANLTGALRPFPRLIHDYRARRPDGLRCLREGRCKWVAAGVVQVLGHHEIMERLQKSDLLNSADICVEHHTDGVESPPDVFKPYDPSFPLPPRIPSESPETYEELIKIAWGRIQEWGVTDKQDVPRLRRCIDRCREYYESDRFPAIYRPNPSEPGKNMLDLILGGPHDVIGDANAWQGNCARVCRHVRKKLKQIVPGLRQPGIREVREKLREFYQNLRIVQSDMEIGGESGLPG